MNQSFLVHGPEDAVGVAVRDLSPGPKAVGRVMDGGPEVQIDLLSEVPLGHKLALRDIDAGAQVIKYGISIGRATQDIKKGEHVHVHNVKGERWA
jgi:(2R)-sulfolactate sulfo-lyase subunit alpha